MPFNLSNKLVVDIETGTFGSNCSSLKPFKTKKTFGTSHSLDKLVKPVRLEGH